MERRVLNRVIGEGPAVSGAWLLTDHTRHLELFEHLWEPATAFAGDGLKRLVMALQPGRYKTDHILCL